MILEMPSLRIHALAPQQVAQAYALVRLVASDLSLDAWCHFANTRISPDEPPSGGIHTVQDVLGNILGFASYTTNSSLHDGRIVTVDNLAALLGAMESVAASHRCSVIQFQLESSSSAVLDRQTRWLLQAAGHSERYVLFSKLLKRAD